MITITLGCDPYVLCRRMP